MNCQIQNPAYSFARTYNTAPPADNAGGAFPFSSHLYSPDGRKRKKPLEAAFFHSLANYLLLLRQMCIFSAWAISSSRNWGWAMPMRASARCQVDRPFMFTMPYSVTR